MLRQPAIREEDERGKKGVCTVKRMAILLLSVLLLTACSGKEKENVFIRIDRDDPNAWREELANVRFLKEERMSGSAQFSETQFLDLAERLKDQAEEVWIVDCRLESHGLMNGMAVSWCGEENGANIGKTVEEVEAEEASFSSLTGRQGHYGIYRGERPAKGPAGADRGEVGNRETAGGKRGYALSAACMSRSLLAAR